MNNLFLGIVLGLYVGIGQVIALSGISINNVLWAGVFAGLCVGNPGVGFQIASACLLMSLGFFTYGGATVPNYTVGAIFGTVVATKTGSYEVGLSIAIALSLLMSQMDILGRATTTLFQHLGEGALAKNNIKLFETWTLCGTLPWILARTIPVCLGMLMIDNVQILADFATKTQWIANGLGIVGAALPAVGFALLLSYMDLKKYWPFLIMGYVGFAYLGMDTIALALVGCALGALFMNKYVGGAQ